MSEEEVSIMRKIKSESKPSCCFEISGINTFFNLNIPLSKLRMRQREPILRPL